MITLGEWVGLSREELRRLRGVLFFEPRAVMRRDHLIQLLQREINRHSSSQADQLLLRALIIEVLQELKIDKTLGFDIANSGAN